MSDVPIEIGHELTVANVSDKSLRQGNRLWLLFASKMNCSPCIRLAVSLHPPRNLPATSAAFSLLGAKREMLITNCRLNRIGQKQRPPSRRGRPAHAFEGVLEPEAEASASPTDT